MEIVVWYTDGSQVRVPVAEAGGLPRAGVLFIVLSAVDPETGRPKRVREKFGKDWYYLLRDAAGRYMLQGWDDKQHRWYDPADPFAYPEDAPPSEMLPDAIVFEGGYLPPAEWERALETYYAEMH